MPTLNRLTALRRHLPALAWIAIALLPVAYITAETAAASRNFPFWDEIDSAIDFILKLSAGKGWKDVVGQFFTLSNEHRMLTSRIIFAVSYWTTGTVNFHVIGLLGNLFIVGACGLLIYAARGAESRIRTGVVLAFLVFQLGNYENFIWSGASIDHFQVVLLSVAAIVLVTRDTVTGCAWGAVLAALATYTLAHGSLTWVLCAAWLVHRRAWPRLGIWSAAGTATLGAFFAGFRFNPGHHIPDLGLGSAFEVVVFWLQMIGSPITMAQRQFAVLPGIVVLLVLGLLIRRGALTKHPVPVLTALFGIGSLALVAFGRVNVGVEWVTSRYIILAVLPWSMALAMLLDEAATPERPFRWLAYALPGLAALNVTAAILFQGPKESFIEVRDRAATFFLAHGQVGEGISRMHPAPARANEVLAASYKTGIYRLGLVSKPVNFPVVERSTRIVGHVDELITNDGAVTIGGWAMIPGSVSRRGHVYVVLQSENAFLVYSTLTLQRPDVARAYNEPKWRLCGFRAVIPRNRLPAQDFRVGLMVVENGKPEYLLTDNQLTLANAGNEQLATSR